MLALLFGGHSMLGASAWRLFLVVVKLLVLGSGIVVVPDPAVVTGGADALSDLVLCLLGRQGCVDHLLSPGRKAQASSDNTLGVLSVCDHLIVDLNLLAIVGEGEVILP